MNLKFSKTTVASLMLVGGLFCCSPSEVIDEPTKEFINIEHLYAQPLPVIQEHIQGKWKLQYSTGVYMSGKEIDIYGSYLHLSPDHIIIGNQMHGVFTDSPIMWVLDENSHFAAHEGQDAYMLTYNHEWRDGNLMKSSTLMPYRIKNDTLIFLHPASDWSCYYHTKY